MSAVARAASPSPAASPTPSATISPTPTPAPTPVLHAATPPPVYPLVNSCNPASVPEALPVVAPPSGKSATFAMHVPILMYHRIVPTALAGDSIRGLVVPPATFSAQLDALQQAGWHTITMGQLANDLQAQVRPPARTFVITIDDGWDDGYNYALPILGKHGYVATFYVIAGRIDLGGFLSTAELQALVASGDEIGDHTMDHLGMSRLPAAKLTYEVDAAAARIAQATGRWPASLAYPSGVWDNAASAAVQACQELRMAVIEEPPTPKPAPTHSPGSKATPAPSPIRPMAALETWANRFVVPRIRVTPSTTPARLVGTLEPFRAG